MNVLGIDVGAGAVKFAVFSADARSPRRGRREPLYSAEEKTARSFPEMKAQILGIIERMKESRGIRAVGIGVPGFISRRERRIEISPNMRFLDGVALEKEIAAGGGLPVFVENDANAAALGEFQSLDAPRPSSFILLTLGSGIGSGIVLEGRLWRGACGFAGELGHLLVQSQGRDCGCGRRGCAETESSEAGIVLSYQELTGTALPISSREVFARLQAGDEAARRAFERAGRYLGVLLCQVMLALDPEWIAIGGGVAAAGDALLAPARDELACRAMARALACTRIEPARLGNMAGVCGAADLARGRLRP
ncbi:MAG: ROK family protein [Candidatus Aminicenantes bacterium]|nr:ROK family protein [Candidatus Aminicenantes bacterium]